MTKPEATVQDKPNSTTESRIRGNAHFARLLRQRLESRHANGALREMLWRLSDAELVETYLENERQGREHAALRAEKETANKRAQTFLALAERIAKHAPPIQVPQVDVRLLVKTAKRLQRSKDVVRHMKCDPREN
jgi:hypothetical protein